MSTPSSPPAAPIIRLRQVRTHNLKGIDLDLPLGGLIVVTGVSGAGKSSLAFDTIYAEGQRRYVETFSAYARQFLEPLEKPDAERIESIPPAIAVAGRESLPSARSTVGTIAEIHEYLSLLFARVGEVICYRCGHLVVPATPRSISAAIDQLAEGTRYEIGFPLEILPGSDPSALARSLLEDGLTRARVEGRLIDLAADGLPAPGTGEDMRVVDVIVDRLVRGNDAPGRRLDSIETAFTRGLGRCRLIVDSGARTFVRGWRCSQCGTDHREPQLRLFRYSSPLGACPRCEGSGRVIELEPDLDPIAAEGAKPERSATRKGPIPAVTSRWKRSQVCPDCRGARLRPEALAVRVEGLNIAELSALTILEAHRRVASWTGLHQNEVAARILDQVEKRLDYLGRIGLDYLSLDRPGRTLSSGELRRVTMARTLGTGLVNTLYVLDEPTIGLHQHDVGRLVAVLNRLRDAGNTLLVVEHEHDLIRAADHLVDLGPGAGEAGGQLLYSGPVSTFGEVKGSLTSDFFHGRKRVEIPASRRQPSRGFLTLAGARGHNLKSIRRLVPAGCHLRGHRRQRSGQEHAGRTDALPRGAKPAAPGNAADRAV